MTLSDEVLENVVLLAAMLGEYLEAEAEAEEARRARAMSPVHYTEEVQDA